MKYNLVVPEDVYEEVEEAGEYYHTQRPGLEMELFEEWEQTLQRILKAPEGYQRKTRSFRLALLDRFPFLVVFEIVGSNIFVYRFINVRRHPGKRYIKRKK
jgi:hypothetical protein